MSESSFPQELTFFTRTNKKLAAKLWKTSSNPAYINLPKRVGICLHGWLDNASSFDLIAPLLLLDSTNMGEHGFDELLALDLAGHGKSDHNPSGIYHPGEHVADIADVLYEMNWFQNPKFSEDESTSTILPQLFIIGHSMGGGIAAIFCGTFQRQISGGLCMIEAVGPWPDNEDRAGENLYKSIVSRRKRRLGIGGKPPRIFPDHNAAAIRRSQGNVVGKLSVAAALILCQRGVKKLEVPILPGSGLCDISTLSDQIIDGYVWSFDPCLLGPSRLKYSPRQAKSFCERLRCPTMVLTVNDGITWRSTKWLGSTAVEASWAAYLGKMLLLMVKCLQYCESLLLTMNIVSTPSNLFLKVANGLKYGLGLQERFGLMKRAVIKAELPFFHAVMKSGGHHPQLTQPIQVANHMLTFLERIPKK